MIDSATFIFSARQKTEFIKIGGTDFPPFKRIREINGRAPYRELGPWSLADFRQVNDWRKVEAFLHFAFRGRLVDEVIGAKELFRVAPQVAAAKLNDIDPNQIVKRPTIDRMFQDTEFSNFVLRLFVFTGLMNWTDIQGAWTFVLFPSTGWGRYFTINIGPHEVAFTTLSQRMESGLPGHAIVMDRLIYDFPEVISWAMSRNGTIRDNPYKSGLPRAVEIFFDANFSDALEFLQLDGVRRALLAYWSEALIGIKERAVLNVFARFHNWNAVAEIRNRILGAV